MHAPRNIYLVGPMGVGKTTIGRQLARRLGKTFADSDLEIERRTGVEISTIFDIEGEDGFRERESKMLRELARRRDLVLATGGGAVLRRANRELLAANGYIVYLQGSAESLSARIVKSPRRRPLLDMDEHESKLLEILRQRAPIYERVAAMTVNTDQRPAAKVVGEIVDRLG